MIAGDIIPARARPWLAGTQATRLRIAVPAFSLLLVWWLAAVNPSPALWGAVGIYAVILLMLVVLRQLPISESQTNALSYAGTFVDLVFALIVSVEAIPVGGADYPLAILVALRVFSQRRRISLASVAPLALMLGHIAAAELVTRIAWLEGLPLVTHWWLMMTGIGLIALAALTSARQHGEVVMLRQALRIERQSREARVAELERTANELRSRMREQHALEEVLRVITSTLSLHEVLNQIVDNTVQTLGRERVTGMTLSLLVDGELTHHCYSREGLDNEPWSVALASRAMQQGVPLIVNDAIHSAEFVSLARHMRSAIAVPLFVGDGPPRGALTVISPTAAAFASSDARHLAAFATQAGIAIGNAELHSRMREQQRLLEAVIRDINDGLIVVNESTEIVLSNPIGRQILGASMDTQPARDRLLSLAMSAYASDQATMMAELKIRPDTTNDSGNADDELVYQAFASLLQPDAGARLVAIVLHDITHQRAEERARTEFISMVSHELRNPLHSLNGFLKVVTQGRAGALNELQQDFLQMADQQVELLKGRITELLEFNRMKAGRLTLRPQMNDLGLLVHGTVTRLALQAEQSNLQLINHAQLDLPTCNFDSERIGQVVTNLIENAIKATPSGGRITVTSQLRDSEVWISVSDTGVGIAPGDVGKIFQRFYRANTQKSVYGSHLGLGLTICQQIIEGHGGRIWVESELNVGSTFTFTLPLVLQEAEVVAD